MINPFLSPIDISTLHNEQKINELNKRIRDIERIIDNMGNNIGSLRKRIKTLEKLQGTNNGTILR